MVNIGGLGGSSVNIVINAVDNFSKVFKKVGLSLKSFQKSALAFAAIGGGIAAGLGMAVKASMDFETAFTGVRKTVDATESEFADLEQRFKDISTTTPVTFVELSKIGELAGQLGVSGVDNLEKFTKTIADISVTTNLTSEEAATGFARFANVMNMPIENADKLGSTIVGLGNNLATTEAEILEMSLRISGAGKALDFTEGQVLGWSAALSSMGIQAQMGGTAISKMMINISSDISNGSEDVEKFAKVAGMSAEDFSKAFKKDASGALQAFFNGLGDIKENGGDVLKVLENLDIKEVRLRDTVLRLASGSDKLNLAMDLQSKEWETNTALTEEAQKRYATFASQVAIVKNKMAVMGDEIGDRLIPFLRDYLIPAIDKIISLWQGLSPQMQNAIILFAAVTAAVFLLGAAIAILTLVSSPWLLILFGIAAAITAIILLFKNWDLVILGFTKVFLRAAGVMDSAWQTFKDGFIIAGHAMKNAFLFIWNTIVSFYETAINKVISGINTLIRAINAVPGISVPMIPKINLSMFKGEMTNMSNLMSKLSLERAQRAMEFETASQQVFDRIAVDKGFTPTGNDMTINIENLNGVDPDEIAQALGDKYKEIMAT